MDMYTYYSGVPLISYASKPQRHVRRSPMESPPTSYALNNSHGYVQILLGGPLLFPTPPKSTTTCAKINYGGPPQFPTPQITIMDMYKYCSGVPPVSLCSQRDAIKCAPRFVILNAWQAMTNWTSIRLRE